MPCAGLGTCGQLSKEPRVHVMRAAPPHQSAWGSAAMSTTRCAGRVEVRRSRNLAPLRGPACHAEG